MKTLSRLSRHSGEPESSASKHFGTPASETVSQRDYFPHLPSFLNRGRGDFESPMLCKPLKSPSIPLYERGKQNLVPWDLHRAFLNYDTVSSAGVTFRTTLVESHSWYFLERNLRMTRSYSEVTSFSLNWFRYSTFSGNKTVIHGSPQSKNIPD